MIRTTLVLVKVFEWSIFHFYLNCKEMLFSGEQAANHRLPLNKNYGLETSEDVRSKANRRCAMTIGLTVHQGFLIPDARPR